jgi:hypothetical protein
MKGRIIFLLPAIALSSSLIATPALADPKSPPPASSIDPQEVYKLALEKHKSDFKVYEDKRREINRVYKEAIDEALSDARLAFATVKSQIQKRQTMSARQNAVVTATAIRDAAIEALGLPPVAPTPPAKSAKFEKDKRKKPPIPTATPQ